MQCSVCHKDIPIERLQAIPSTNTCVKCSNTKEYIGMPVFPHKTGSFALIIDPNKATEDGLRQAKRANSRAR